MHFLFVCKDTYACLSLKFERKKEVSIGELQLVTQQSEEAGPLSNIRDKTLDKEQNIQEPMNHLKLSLYNMKTN